MLLSILIPTYNRCEFVERNIREINKMLLSLNAQTKIKIIVSDNNSTDSTFEKLSQVTSELNTEIVLLKQSENIGSVNNVLYLLDQATTEFVLFLGDDDYLQLDYLSSVLAELETGTVGLIIPSNQAVDLCGEKLPYGRDLEMKYSNLKPGFFTCLKHSWRGHQMSGLVFRRDGLSGSCNNLGVKNLYLFIFLVAFCSLRYRTVHLTHSPILVSRPPQHLKDWSYGDDGLVLDVFDNYCRIPGLKYWQRVLLELRLFDQQYWRYMMYLKLGLPRFFLALLKIFFGKNTSLVGGLVGFILIPLFLLCQMLKLAFRGELLVTLKKRVDI